MNNSEYRELINPNNYTGQIFQSQGPGALLNYLNKPQAYQVVTVAADWGILQKGNFLMGKLGHHALLLLAGNRTCEWTPTKTDITKTPVTQSEQRTVATGKQIEKMWKTHLELAPKYHRTGEFFDPKKEGYLHYRPWTNDCFNYVDRILTANDQPPTKLNRTANSLIDFSQKAEPLSKTSAQPKSFNYDNFDIALANL